MVLGSLDATAFNKRAHARKCLGYGFCETPEIVELPMATQEIETWKPAHLSKATWRTVAGRCRSLLHLAPTSAMKSLRWIFAALVFATTASMALRLWNILCTDGLTGAEFLFWSLVTILFGWIAVAFWINAFGAFASLRRSNPGSLAAPAALDPALRASPSMTAVLFPIRNEETPRLIAGIESVIASLSRRNVLDRFDIFLLSDSCGADQLEREQSEYLALRARWRGHANIYYRHRTSNTGRKSGNIAQFCRNWGGHYDYMVVLDADSLMTAKTLVGLVQLMDANPRAGLIQTPSQLAGRDSLFARIQQFAASVYGPLCTAGFALLFGGDGNYWGHNAIIRVRAFIDSCGLPELPGPAPLGGEILSHDFIEAALLRKAGWQVHVASHLSGSYEEPPPGLIDFLKRDRRWCQGNLQHIRLIFTRGFHVSSRWHLMMGVMAYLSSPLWFALLLISGVVLLQQPHIQPYAYIGSYPLPAWPVSHTQGLNALIYAMVMLLFVPKVMALLFLLRDPAARRAHGGGVRATMSVLLETAFSALLAPIMMLSQSAFVASILLGRSSGWGAQQRHERRLALKTVGAVFWPHTLLGAAAMLFACDCTVGSEWWFALLAAGPLLSIPLTMVASSIRCGNRARQLGLFIAPWETGAAPIVAQTRATLAARLRPTGPRQSALLAA